MMWYQDDLKVNGERCSSKPRYLDQRLRLLCCPSLPSSMFNVSPEEHRDPRHQQDGSSRDEDDSLSVQVRVVDS